MGYASVKNLVLFGMTALLLATSAGADTRERAITITTDAFDGSFSIDVMRNASGTLTQMIYQTPVTSNGVLTPAQLAQGPQVIYAKQGHDAILLSTESDFNVQKGGHLIVRLVHNALEGSYIDFRVLVDVEKTIILRSDPNSNDSDSDNNSYTGVFNRLFLQKNTVFGIAVGVDQVVPSEQ